jgi:hypothetical protein
MVVEGHAGVPTTVVAASSTSNVALSVLPLVALAVSRQSRGGSDREATASPGWVLLVAAAAGGGLLLYGRRRRRQRESEELTRELLEDEMAPYRITASEVAFDAGDVLTEAELRSLVRSRAS